MDALHMFRYRRPPKKEIYAKLLALCAFGVFCAVVGFNVAHLPLPSAKRGVLDVSIPAADHDSFKVPTLSSADRVRLEKLSTQITVPYLTPWGEGERPAICFMWYLLYRSLKPDLDKLTANLLNTSTINATASEIGSAATHNQRKVVIDVVESHEGYITTSLAHFLPTTYVFSVVASAPAEQQYGWRPLDPRYRRGAKDAYDFGSEDLAAKRQAYAERVATKVVRVLANPVAEGAAEASQQPGVNGGQPAMETGVQTATAEKSSAGGDTFQGISRQAEAEAVTQVTPPPHVYLCVPRYSLNSSYYASMAAQELRVSYQILLFPHVALRGVRTSAEFDVALRTLLAQANVASFIALPWLSESGNVGTGSATNGEPAHHRRLLLERELIDYERWYEDYRWTPSQVLQRALSSPDMEAQYHVSILPLGSKWWFGALRQLFRVELQRKHDRSAANVAVRFTTITVDTASARADGALAAIDGSGTNTPAASPLPSLVANMFGCAARQVLLGCVEREHHSSCEQFSEVHVL
ncbi:conserved hypothetical protein [Leishmania major strain Friedlin]|uniref:Uncharacterized protein n=1 Tax=Leishmania major TaxID=5664 RepID=Q4Q5C9_LEIMA|nr:conserved hypothetical protein [Leishmania major strain Friedlin]CAG9580237.1 hypothetical_protein_-_conserved [Leishmania major strain Friedlin]CAJ08673.1 conserved hypothetical protein [Leishmania major strain Friedlin]|eukprot:XP_001685469.1 conserved hypothetical protein [Leishmania major strain Friedlin]